MTAYTTGASGGGYTGLNWTPGTNVTAQLRALCLSLNNTGHSLRLEGMFNLSGLRQITTPQNFTIDAIPDVGGFNFTDTATRGDECMTVSAGNTFKNLRLDATNSPPYNPNAGNNPVRGTDYHASRSILVNGDDFLLEACLLKGRINHQISINGDNCTVRLCEITEGFWALQLQANNGTVIEYCWFHDWYVDAIKTMNFGLGTRNATLRFCNFKAGNGRDVVDFTGGWYNGVIHDLKVHGCNVVVFDYKMGFDSPSDLTLNRGLCHNTTISRVIAVSCNRICTLTHLDNGNENDYTINGQPALYTNPSNGPTYAPQNLVFNDCDWQQFAQNSWLLMKGGHTVVTNNCRWRGLTSAQQPAGRTSYNNPAKPIPSSDPYYDVYVALTNSMHYGIVNNGATTPAVLSLASDWYLPTFQYGPGATSTTDPGDPEEPAIPPAPVSAGPALSINASTGLLSVDPSRLPPQTAKEYTARVTTGHGTASDTFPVTVI
jgi:hypothetical protein